MKLTLKNLNDEIMTVDVEGTDSIKKVKERIQEKHGISVESQILILGGQILKDDELLAYYNITEESILTIAINKIVKFDENVKDAMIEYFEDNKIKQNKASEYIKNNLKNNELNVNLIHFDLNIKSQENYIYYNEFKINENIWIKYNINVFPILL